MDAVSGNKSFTINDWRVDPALNRLSRADDVIKIDPQNMKVLELLASRPGVVISQPEIEQLAWSGVIVTPNSVYQSIAQLRRALGDDKANPRFIETIARKGYRLVAEVSYGGESAENVSPGLLSVLRVRLIAPRSKVTASALLACLALSIQLYSWLHSQGKAESGERSSTGLDIFESAMKSPNAQVSRLADLGERAAIAGRPRQAISYYEQALSLQRQSGDDDPFIADFLTELARLHVWTEDLRRAEVSAREALHFAQQVSSDLNPRVIAAHGVLGEVLTSTGNFAEAEANIKRSIELARIVYGESEMRTAEARYSLALLRYHQGSYAGASALLEDVLPIFLKKHGSEEPSTALLRATLANSLCSMNECARAVTEATESVRILQANARPDHPYLATAKQALADSLMALGYYSEAEAAARDALRLWQENDAAPWRIARVSSSIGEALMHQGKVVEGQKYLSYASGILRDDRGILEKAAFETHRSRAENWRVLSGNRSPKAQ